MSNDSNSWWDWTDRMLMKYSKETTYIGYFPARVGLRFKSAAPNNAEVQLPVLCITLYLLWNFRIFLGRTSPSALPLHQQSCNFCLVNLVHLSWCYLWFHQGVLTWRQCPLNESGTGIAAIHAVEVCQSTGSNECSNKCLSRQTSLRLSMALKMGSQRNIKIQRFLSIAKLLDPILCHICFCLTSWKQNLLQAKSTQIWM